MLQTTTYLPTVFFAPENPNKSAANFKLNYRGAFGRILSPGQTCNGVIVMNIKAKALLRSFRNKLLNWFAEGLIETGGPSPAKAAQQVLYQTFRNMASDGKRPLPRFDDVGFRCHSQFEEDGILLYIFALIGTTNKKVVEICASNGIECNAANLILNHGWWGYLFDGCPRSVARGREFYSISRDSWLFPPRFEQAWITAENINTLLTGAGVSGEIDLLSLDIDGVDYWVLAALEAVRPRVIVCEINNLCPSDASITVPYAPDFRMPVQDFYGASLSAMTGLARKKGYRLVGTNRYGNNAFFVRNDCGEQFLPEVDPSSCQKDPYTEDARKNRWPKVKDLNWVKV